MNSHIHSHERENEQGDISACSCFANVIPHPGAVVDARDDFALFLPRARARTRSNKEKRLLPRGRRDCPVHGDVQKPAIPARIPGARYARDNINLRFLSRFPSCRACTPSCKPTTSCSTSVQDAGTPLPPAAENSAGGFGVARSRARGMKHRVAPWDRASGIRVPRAIPLPCTHAFFTPVD